MSSLDLAPLVRHALRFGDECVLETAAETCRAYVDVLRSTLIPPPVDLTWMSPTDRERVLDERLVAREAFHVEAAAVVLELERLPAEIALARAKAGKPSALRLKARRRTTPALREQVRALADRGLVVAAIANTLNVSDRRVRDLLGKTGNRRNGALNPSVQAGNSVDCAFALQG